MTGIDEALNQLLDHWMRLIFHASDGEVQIVDGHLKAVAVDLLTLDIMDGDSLRRLYVNRSAIVLVSVLDWGTEKPTLPEPKTGMSV